MSPGHWMRRAKAAVKKTPLYGAYRSARAVGRVPARIRLGIARLLFLHPVPLFGRYPGFLYPKFLSVSLTTRCNLRCFICRREEHVGTDLEFRNLRKLENAIRHASTIDLTGWGECFVYPKLGEVLEYIFSLNGRKNLIRITTNGTLLSREWGERLRGRLASLLVSLNAASAASYARDMKHGDFARTLRSIENFLSVLDGTDRRKVTLHFVAHTENFREIPDFVRLARGLGVTHVTVGQYLAGIPEHRRFVLLNVKDEYNAVCAEADAAAEALGVDFFAWRFHKKAAVSPRACTDPLESCFIETDGQVGPCCYSGSYRIGNAYASGFEAVWFGEEYRRLRRERYLPACRTCTPFIPFDDPRAHFTAYLKEQGDLENAGSL